MKLILKWIVFSGYCTKTLNNLRLLYQDTDASIAPWFCVGRNGKIIVNIGRHHCANFWT